MLNNEFCVKEVEFMDDTFTLNKRRTEEICDLMIKEGEWWSCSAHANTIDKGVAEKLKKNWLSRCFHRCGVGLTKDTGFYRKEHHIRAREKSGGNQ